MNSSSVVVMETGAGNGLAYGSRSSGSSSRNQSNLEASHSSLGSAYDPELAAITTASEDTDRTSKTLTPQLPEPKRSSSRISFKETNGEISTPTNNNYNHNSNNNSPSPPRRSYDFQQALRLDDLEVKIEELKRSLRDRDQQVRSQQEKIIQLENQVNVERSRGHPNTSSIAPSHANALTSSSTLPVGLSAVEERVEHLIKEKEILLTDLNASREEVLDLRRQLEKSSNSNSVSAADEGSLRLYDPNHPATLKRKIADLESQLQDQQEAYQSLLLLTGEDKQATEKGSLYVENLERENQLLRDEVKQLKYEKSCLALDEALLRQVEHLKSDVEMLKSHNDKLMKESQSTVMIRANDNIPIISQQQWRAPTVRNEFYEDRSRILKEIVPPSTSMTRSFNISKSRSFVNVSSFERERSMSRNDVFLSSDDEEENMLQPPVIQSRNRYPNKKASKRRRQAPNNFLKKPMAINLIDDAASDLTSNLLEDGKDVDSISLCDTASILSHAEREINDMRRLTSASHTMDSDSNSLRSLGINNTRQRNRDLSQSFNNCANYVRTSSSTAKYSSSSLNKSNNKVTTPTDPFSTVGRSPYAPRHPTELRMGDIIKFSRQAGRISKGLIHFIGSLPGRRDCYLGVELDAEDGKHDGIYEGRRYFHCKRNKGVFVAFNKVIMCYGKLNQ